MKEPITFAFPLETAPSLEDEYFPCAARYNAKTGRNYGLPDVDYTIYKHQDEMEADLRRRGYLRSDEHLTPFGWEGIDETGRKVATFTFYPKKQALERGFRAVLSLKYLDLTLLEAAARDEGTSPDLLIKELMVDAALGNLAKQSRQPISPRVEPKAWPIQEPPSPERGYEHKGWDIKLPPFP